MSEKEFKRQSHAAMEFMKEMKARADNKNTNPTNCKEENPIKNIKKEPCGITNTFPFADILKNGDTALILGLLLLLFSENADKKLLFALIYILL